MPPRVYHGRNPCVGHPNHREPLFDGAHSGLGKVLIWTGKITEPRIIGDLKEPTWAISAWAHLVRKNRFVTYQRLERPADGGLHQLGALARRIACANGVGQLRPPQGSHGWHERDVFAKWHQVVFVIPA